MARLALAPLVALLLGCSGSSVTAPEVLSEDTVATGTGSTALPAMYSHFFGVDELYRDGDWVVIRSDDLPDHASPYYGQGHPLYMEPASDVVVNPNRIAEQDFVFRLPANPATAATGTQTNLGAIGVAINGVVLFNQYAGPGFQPLDNEFFTFDRYNGHPQQTGVYHYHVEPVSVTAGDPSALVGVLLDGFPVYGPVEQDGSLPAGLDECNGHLEATPDHPEGIYHYHLTSGFPYISGCFRGNPGSVTN